MRVRRCIRAVCTVHIPLEVTDIHTITSIDDYSRCCNVYFMKNKSEVFNKFKEFELITTNECGCSMRTLRTDNGGEYLSKEFDSYLHSMNFQPLNGPSSFGKQTASCESPHDWLMSLALDVAALCGMWR